MPSPAISRASAFHQLAAMPAVWLADEIARSVGATWATGHALLDAALPGGGWPVGALVEVLQAQAGQGEWRLLLPALVSAGHLDGHLDGWTEAKAGGSRDGRERLVLVNPPHRPFLPGLAAQGLDASRLLLVQGPGSSLDPAASVWACEQALRCAGVAAVLAWLPQVRPEQLRRLQIAAQTYQQCLFVMRPAAAQHEASPAVLRLLVETADGTDALAVRILKRRGPPLVEPLVLPARPARLQALLAANRLQAARRRPAAAGAAPVMSPASATAMVTAPRGVRHALDRPAAVTAH